MEIKNLSEEEFLKFTKNYSISSIYQTTNYGKTMNEENFDIMYLGLEDEGKILCATLLLIGNINGYKYAYAKRGFLIDYADYNLLKEFTIQLKKYLSKLSIMAIKLCPNVIKSIYDYKKNLLIDNKDFLPSYDNLSKLGYYHFGFNNYFEALEPRFEAVIDLRHNKEELFNSIKKKFKTKIRSCKKNGLYVIEENKENLNTLYELFKRKSNNSLNYYKNLINNFNNIELYSVKMNTINYLQEIKNEYEKIDDEKTVLDNLIIKDTYNEKLLNKKLLKDREFDQIKEKLNDAILLQTKYNGEFLLAAAIIIKYNDTIYLIEDGYNKQYKNYNAKHFLIWSIMEKYANKYKKFNLGGTANYSIDSKYNGLNEFKRSFNAKNIEYIGDFELITNRTLYFMYKQKFFNIFRKKKSN